jgi:hypothetical protein
VSTGGKGRADNVSRAPVELTKGTASMLVVEYGALPPQTRGALMGIAIKRLHPNRSQKAERP